MFFNDIARAQEENKKQKFTSVTYAQQHVIHSKVLNEERKINIFLPESFYEVSVEHTYPILLLLEDEFFLMVSGVMQHLSSVERMPEVIIVSLVDGPKVPKYFTNQSDFWPTDWKKLPFGENPDLFTEHLKQELFPYIRNSFRANDFKIVMGLSGTSIYALRAYTKEPDLFNAHIAIASGDILGMGYNEGERLIDCFMNDFNKTPEKKGYLYVTLADSGGNGNSPMIRENLEELERRLTNYRSDNFQFISRIYPNEGHYDVALPALHEAIELIFPKEKWFAKYREIIKEPGNALSNIDIHFQKLSNEYGFEISPKAERWNSGNSLSRIGPFLLRQENVSEAIDVIERWAEYRPKSTTALKELAKAYAVNNQFNKAISVLEKALALST